MAKYEEPLVKVKTLTATAWKREPYKKGATLEIPQEVLELNPTIFERVEEDEKAKKAES